MEFYLFLCFQLCFHWFGLEYGANSGLVMAPTVELRCSNEDMVIISQDNKTLLGWRSITFCVAATPPMWNNGWQTSIAREMTHLSRVIRTLSLIE